MFSRKAIKTPTASPTRAFKSVWNHRDGNFAVILGLLAPIVLGLVGGGTDLFVYEHHRNELQDTVDASALAAVREASLKGWSTASASEVAAAEMKSNLTNRFSGFATFTYTTTVDEKAREVSVSLSQDHYGYFFLGYFTGSPQIAVHATARQTGQETICIIAQKPQGQAVLKVDGNATVSAIGCSSYAGSSHPKGLSVKGKSVLSAKLSCTVGGFEGTGANYSPLPITDCPAIPDPLELRARSISAALSTACTFSGVNIKNATATLSPGTYCGGLKVTSGATVTFAPGTYVLKEGQFQVDGKSSISGDGVGFVFVGDKANLNFMNDSDVSLSAPETGMMAGILFYAQPSSTNKARNYNIQSRNAGRLIGTVYLPADNLIVGGDKDGDGICDTNESYTASTPIPEQCITDVGTQSPWTAIVTYTMHVTAGATLVINSNYSSSAIPVPEGIGPHSGRIVLTK